MNLKCQLEELVQSLTELSSKPLTRLNITTLLQRVYLNFSLKLTTIASEGYSHLSFVSITDMKMGRFLFTLGLSASAMILYFDPGYIHETVRRALMID